MNAPITSSSRIKVRSLGWRRAASPLSPQCLSRQGLIANLAFSHLGGRDPAILFLNSYNPGPGAGPLDLARDCVGGYATVQSEVRRLETLAVCTPQ